MTAEILIMNRNAIAMAADSAVTVGSLKTYTGVNKLFMLSNTPPMGIMIYGSAEFCHMPFETLIKEYRTKNENEGYTKVNTIMLNFLKFIEKYAKTKSDPKAFFDMQLEYFELGVNKELDEIKDDNILKLLENLTDDVKDDDLQIISQTKDFENKEEIFEKLALKHFLKNKNKHAKIKNLLKKLFFKQLFMDSTGIVIAGFNEEDIYPSFSSYKVLTILDGKLIHLQLEEDENEVVPRIIPFAQRDVVDAFLTGFNLEIAEDLKEFFGKTIAEYPNKILNPLKQNKKLKKGNLKIIKNEIKNIEKENEGILEKFSELILKSVDESYFPILMSIGALPKEELANMCESLIHITSLKSKVSYGLDSVGGDVDVAIISKGDGFIWAKRKHYFNSDLNIQFFQRKNKKI